MVFQDGFNKKFIENIVVYIVAVISAILLALIITDCFDLYFYREKSLVILPPPPAVQSQTKTLQEYVDSSAPLFRFSDKSSQASSNNSAEILSASNLKLKATFVGDRTSIAVIAAAGDEQIFIIGDTISDMQIEDILPDRVILSKSNSMEPISLRMDYGFAINEPAITPIGAQSSQSGGSSTQREVSKREFTALLDPPDRIAKEVALAPIGREGNPYGIQMTFVKPGSLIQQMGFMPGDILLSMNNKQLLTPEDGMIAYQTMKNEESVTFKIERGGSVVNLNISFK